MTDFFHEKRGWISQLFDSSGSHVGTRQFLFKDEAHLVITTYDTNGQLLSSEHVFPLHESDKHDPLNHLDFFRSVTKRLAESENSKMLNSDDPKLII